MLTERAKTIVPKYEENFSDRGGVTPTEPIEYHLYHLACYWSRILGFIRRTPGNSESLIEGNFGACIEVGNHFLAKSITPSSDMYRQWVTYSEMASVILYKRPVHDEDIELTFERFNECLAAVDYDPWANSP